MSKLINLMLDPTPLRLRVLARLDRAWNFLSYEQKLLAGLIDRPEYGWPLHRAAHLAKILGHERISAIEFGVAGGNGLLALEMHAEEVERRFGVGIDIYGFDTGAGLPPPTDYRDLPYLYREGFFGMDVDALQARLKRSKLIIGDVSETVPSFFDRFNPAPVGFVSVDTDLYSSAVNVLGLFKHDRKFFLPRVPVYFDDVMGDIDWAFNEFTGELLAIREFNAQHENMKIDQPRGMQAFLRHGWPTERIYVAHLFDHPSYGSIVNSTLTELPLRAEAPKQHA